MDWIDCEVRQPKVEDDYLVTTKSGNRQVSHWFAEYVEGDYFRQGKWSDKSTPIAWMEIPEAYKK